MLRARYTQSAGRSIPRTERGPTAPKLQCAAMILANNAPLLRPARNRGKEAKEEAPLARGAVGAADKERQGAEEKLETVPSWTLSRRSFPNWTLSSWRNWREIGPDKVHKAACLRPKCTARKLASARHLEGPLLLACGSQVAAFGPLSAKSHSHESNLIWAQHDTRLDGKWAPLFSHFWSCSLAPFCLPLFHCFSRVFEPRNSAKEAPFESKRAQGTCASVAELEPNCLFV